MWIPNDIANVIFDILVKDAGAQEHDRQSFVNAHDCTKNEYQCLEFRFCGDLGFGGKYWSNRNKVDCYAENYDSRTKKIIDTTNQHLKELYDNLGIVVHEY